MRNRSLLVLLGGWPALAFADAPCGAEHLRWAASSNRIYVTGAVTCTLTDIDRLLPDAPLEAVRPNVWLLGANLQLMEGATLVVDGTTRGGDADELRLLSEPTRFVELRAEWGTLLLRGTRVTSWDPTANGPDTTHEDGRAFVRAVSFLDGDTPRESRMDVIESDIGHLGYYAAESYGLVWKVRDPTPHVFELVDVRGDIVDSTVHHNYFGMYSYGAYGMRIAGSEFHDNVEYGIDPHDDSDALVIEDNSTHDNGNHGFICSKRCDGLIVRRNTSARNVGTGFMLHRAVTDTVVEDNLAEDNRDAGFALMDSHANIVRNNVARGNAFGVRLSVGASDNLVADNSLCDNTLFGIYLYRGTDPPTINDGRPTGNTFANNDVSRNGQLGLRASGIHANDFVGNVFRANGTFAAFLFDSGDNRFLGNDLDGSYIRADGASANAVVDSDAAGVQLQGYDAVMTFSDTTRRVFANDAARATAVTADGSTVTLSGDDGAGVLGVDALALRVTPDEGTVAVDPVSWGPVRRAWTLTPESASRVRFEVGGLAPGSQHVLWVDGAVRQVLTARDAGFVEIYADATEPHSFVLESPARITPGPVPIPR